MVAGSIPWSRSPISASPESFRRTRRNGAVRWSGVAALVTRLLCQGEAAEPRPPEARLLECGADLLAAVVDPLLLVQDEIGQPLVDPSLDDLGLDLIRLV